MIGQYLNSDGYLQAKLCKDGSCVTYKIHRLVASHFVPNPNDYSEVNHIDCNRSNNVYTNLQWVSHLNNVRHSAKLGHYSTSKLCEKNGRSRPVRIWFTSNEFKDFPTITAAGTYLINHDFVNEKQVRTERAMHDHITRAIKSNKLYCNLRFEFIKDNTVPTLESDLEEVCNEQNIPSYAFNM